MQPFPLDGDKKPLMPCFRSRFLKRASGVQFTEAQVVVLLALLFWVSTYSLFSVRSVLFPPDGIDVISTKRLITTFLGAMLFLFAIMRLRHPSKKGRDRHKLLVISSTVAASTVMFALRVAYNDLAEPYAFDLTDHGRWVLVWGGYFLAGLALFSPQERVAAIATQDNPKSEKEPEMGQVIWVRGNKRSIRLLVSSIEWLEAQGNYVYVHATEASGMLRSSLLSLEEKLQPHGFIRVHRSALCQKRHMQGLKRTSAGTLAIILNSGAELPVGRRYAANVTELMND